MIAVTRHRRKPAEVEQTAQRGTAPYLDQECEWKELQKMSSCYSCQPRSQNCFPTPSSGSARPSTEQMGPRSRSRWRNGGHSTDPSLQQPSKAQLSSQPSCSMEATAAHCVTAAVESHNSIAAPCPKPHQVPGYAPTSTSCVLIWKQVSSLELWVLF